MSPALGHWTGGTSVSKEHTELHEVIYGYFGPSLTINSYKSPDQQDHELTDVILAAGYRKPRTVTTVEELDALPNESLILDAQNRCREGLTSIEGRNWWRTMGPAKVLSSKDIQLPATVLHEGQA